MLMYFIVFGLLGFFTGRLMTRDKGILIIIVLSVLWGVSFGPVWGLASMGEMFLGFYIASLADKK